MMVAVWWRVGVDEKNKTAKEVEIRVVMRRVMVIMVVADDVAGFDWLGS